MSRAGCKYLPPHAQTILGSPKKIKAIGQISSSDDENTIVDAINLSESLIDAELFEEARTLLRDYIPRSRRTHGDRHDLTLTLRSNYAEAIYRDTSCSLSDVHEAVAILEDVLRTTRQVFGVQHPNFADYQEELESARMRLAYDESESREADA